MGVGNKSQLGGYTYPMLHFQSPGASIAHPGTGTKDNAGVHRWQTSWNEPVCRTMTLIAIKSVEPKKRRTRAVAGDEGSVACLSIVADASCEADVSGIPVVLIFGGWSWTVGPSLLLCVPIQLLFLALHFRMDFSCFRVVVPFLHPCSTEILSCFFHAFGDSPAPLWTVLALHRSFFLAGSTRTPLATETDGPFVFSRSRGTGDAGDSPSERGREGVRERERRRGRGRREVEKEGDRGIDGEGERVGEGEGEGGERERGREREKRGREEGKERREREKGEMLGREGEGEGKGD
eukprot:scaffold17_cov354-Pavlova_lutheri.AAC.19